MTNTPVLSVGKVYTDTRYPSRPFAVNIRIGSIVRVERYGNRDAAKRARKQLRADVVLLTKAIKKGGK